MSGGAVKSAQTEVSLVPCNGKEEENAMQNALTTFGNLLTPPDGHDSVLSDVEVVAEEDGVSFFAHRVILAARSEFFRGLFVGGMEESYQKRVVIKGMNGDVLRSVLLHIYTGRLVPYIDTSPSVVLSLLEVSSKFHLPFLHNYCTQQLSKQISVSEACNAMIIGEKFGARSVLISAFGELVDFSATEESTPQGSVRWTWERWITASTRFLAAENVRSPPPGFGDVPLSLFASLLQSEDIDSSEIEIFGFVVQWAIWNITREPERILEDTPSGRRAAIQEILEESGFMKLVRFPIISRKDLALRVCPIGIIPSSVLVDAHRAAVVGTEEGKYYQFRNGGSRRFRFRNDRHGPNIVISEDGMMATKQGSSYEVVMGDIEFSSGYIYFEVEIVRFMESEDMFIGVCKPEMDTQSENISPNSSSMWSFLCSSGARVHDSRENFSTAATSTGQRIGVYVDMSGHRMGIFVNGDFRGWAFEDITADVLVPVVCLYYNSASIRLHFPPRPHSFNVVAADGHVVGHVDNNSDDDDDDEDDEEDDDDEYIEGDDLSDGNAYFL